MNLEYEIRACLDEKCKVWKEKEKNSIPHVKLPSRLLVERLSSGQPALNVKKCKVKIPYNVRAIYGSAWSKGNNESMVKYWLLAWKMVNSCKKE